MTGHNRIGSAAYTSSTPKLDLEAARQFKNPPPAIVQSAQRTNQYFEQRLAKNTSERDAILAEWKQSGVWKDKYDTWADACEANGISVSQANRIVKKQNDASCANIDHKKEEAALKSVEAARKPEPEPDPEPEKPAVHSADEKHKDGFMCSFKPETKSTPRPAPSESGKPKTDLRCWTQAEDCGGAFLRAVDALHRQCPNTGLHAKVVAGIKANMAMVETWREGAQ